MNSTKRPFSVSIIAGVYMAVAGIGFVYHFRELLAWQRDSIWVELVGLLALVAGVFLLRGHNWARWLALAWMGFHVVISFPQPGPFAIHCLLFVVIAWFLFQPGASGYFRGTGVSR